MLLRVAKEIGFYRRQSSKDFELQHGMINLILEKVFLMDCGKKMAIESRNLVESSLK